MTQGALSQAFRPGPLMIVLSWGPGLLLCSALAVGAELLGRFVGLPAMLLALLAGMGVAALHPPAWLGPGAEVSARGVLRLGVACLGAKLTWEQISGLGGQTAALVVSAVAATLVLGAFVGRALRLSWAYAVLCAGSVAICGASAALAIAAALPDREDIRGGLPLVVGGVTVLSTIAMIVYPVAAQALGLSEAGAAIFLGATIHDVAQVAGAGFAVSPDAGQTAVTVKLARVACLLPVVAAVAWCFHGRERLPASAALPWFLLAFVALAAARSFGLIGAATAGAISDVGRALLLVSIVALGLKTRPRDLARVGWRPLAGLLGVSALLAGGVGAVLAVGDR